jgi:hypothetical protein
LYLTVSAAIASVGATSGWALSVFGSLRNTVLQKPQFDDPPLLEFIAGDECLFCHRFETGQSWETNRHNRTIRRVENDDIALLRQHPQSEAAADQVEFVMGGKNRIRFLKKGRDYGHLDLLSTEGIPPSAPDKPGRVAHAENPQWNSRKFGADCAGCHATQTNAATQSFSAVSLDCYVCHGNVSLDHTTKNAHVLFGRSRPVEARVVAFSCGQCHLRGGRSKSSGLPYPKNYVAGGDLFRDFHVSLAAADDPQLNPGDRHIYHNVRSVIELRNDTVSCLSCHSVHTQSTLKHRRVRRSETCYICHDRDAARWTPSAYEVHSTVCEY